MASGNLVLELTEYILEKLDHLANYIKRFHYEISLAFRNTYAMHLLIMILVIKSPERIIISRFDRKLK